MRDALHSYLRSSGLGSRLRDWPVYEAWGKVVGETLAQRARPVRFAGGELVIEVESAPQYQELKNFTGEQYRLLANRELGRTAIERVTFKLKS